MNHSIVPTEAEAEAEAFLKAAPQFQLGKLITEQPHPLTTSLSTQAREDLPAAIRSLRKTDHEALKCLPEHLPKLLPLAESIAATLAARRRVFLCGCGATGRLSISLEIFARQGLFGDIPKEAVVAFMAGGDAALVRSIESFEDFPEYGSRQLRELGFGQGDLLISTTEGGETPFVIGATEAAARLSSNRPFFLYCNPDAVLREAVERSRRVLEDPDIHSIDLTVGPMAITGSTRMQASTVLMAAVGWAMACRDRPASLHPVADRFLEWFEATDSTFLEPFIEKEAELYSLGAYLLYEARDFGITVLTDTTERSPTFSLPPFENSLHPDDPTSLCYLHIPGTPNAGEAWRHLLSRSPRTLEWEGLAHLTGNAPLNGFDFSDSVLEARATLGPFHRFQLLNQEHLMVFRFEELSQEVTATGQDGFSRHLMLKMLLNTHSTLVMGRLGRFEGNVMTYVKPTNYKLIDRAIRYVRLLLEKGGGPPPSYEEVAREIFRQRTVLQPAEPVVLKTVEAFTNRSNHA